MSKSSDSAAGSATAKAIFESDDESIYTLRTTAAGPSGRLPFAPEQLRNSPSGDLFGWTQDVGMGWSPEKLGGAEILILSTAGGMRRDDGSPIALGFHTGHWEVGLLVEEASKVLAAFGAVPFAAACSDPCDGRTQGTTGMFDSLAYRNDAAMVFGRLIRSLPTRRGVIGVATCDKGLPATMMALAGCHDLPTVLIPGGVTLLSEDADDLGRIQTIGARFSHGELSLDRAAEMACRACGSPGGGCQFLGTAATSQVVAEALGMTLPHSALSPSGADIWRDMARRSALAMLDLEQRGLKTRDILTQASIRNAMVVHAAFGGSTNLIMHLAAIAHAAGLRRPNADDWREVNAVVPRIVDALPNGPHGYATVQVFLAGGVPEVMLHLAEADKLDLGVLTASGRTLGENLDWWRNSDRRKRLKAKLLELDKIDSDTVIMTPTAAAARGLTSTVTFPGGNLSPEGSVVKSTAIDPDVVDDDGVYRHEGPVRAFVSERAAIAAVKSEGPDAVKPGDIMVLMGIGPIGAGMPETAQVTMALKHLSWGKEVTLITDGRFSGVSTGACIGHVSPEAWAGGPIGKLRDGDRIRVEIDCRNLTGTLSYIGDFDELLKRPQHPDLTLDPALPDDTRLWAALQNVSGGSWGGCVYDVDAIIERLNSNNGNC